MKSLTSSRSASLLGLAALAVLGLAAAPAQAQHLYLNSGDTVTVSGAGTVGTIGGQPVANMTATTYTAAGSGSAVVTNGTSTFTLENGGTLTASGSEASALFLQGEGAVTVDGGTISSTSPYDSAIYAQGPLTILGGSISAAENGRALDAENGSSVTIGGGLFSAKTGGFGLYDAYGTINLFSLGGTKFSVDDTPIMNGTLSSSAYRSGSHTIMGTLENGDILNTTFQDKDTINLNVGTAPVLPAAPVPEASTTVSLGLLLMLGLGGVLAAKKKAARTV